MFRRHPNAGAAQGCPGDGRVRRRDPRLLPTLTPFEPWATRGGARSSRVLGDGGAWWQDRDSEPAVRARSPAPRLPAVAAATPRPPQSRSVLESLLLPPLRSARASRASAPRRLGPREGEEPRRGVAGEAPDSLGALLGELLPNRFREFLCQLRDKCAEQLEPPSHVTRKTPARTVCPPRRPPSVPSTSCGVPAPSTARHQRGASEHGQGSAQCPGCPFLPRLRAQPSCLQDSLKKILQQQLTALGPPRGDHPPFSGVRRHHSPQPPKLKAALAHSSQRDSSGPRRRCCPFRVRFADETLRESALRYWERTCSVQQSFVDSRTPTLPDLSEQVSQSIESWLDHLPRSLSCLAREQARASLSRWDCPDPPAQELQDHLSEDAPMSRRLPFLTRASTPRQRRAPQASLDTHNTQGQVDKAPSSCSQKLESFLPGLVLQSVLRRGRPKGYQLLLPSAAAQRAQR
ncbi:uncharacterized protein C9orf50 homolog [Lepus europaeus]|uniref:uncharacterized protein C9orf50 homolog n=1 Tax=Lepus europaeus TaxID=9983 RepID=UPI002B48AB3A|nr:uncharacterized protein C9orf50 homolog [Lepus europaeus]